MLLAAFIAIALAATAYSWKSIERRSQGLVIVAGLALMVFPHTDLWEFGIWVAAAYLADVLGEDAAVGSFLTLSALFYPLTAIGFNPWLCQFLANVFGLLAVICVAGLGSNIFGQLRRFRGRGIDFMGHDWGGVSRKA